MIEGEVSAYACLSREISHRQQLSSVGVNKCFNPCVGLHVLDLDDVSQGSCSIGSREVLQRCWVVVPFPLELLLDVWQDTLEVDSGLSGRDLVYRITIRN